MMTCNLCNNAFEDQNGVQPASDIGNILQGTWITDIHLFFKQRIIKPNQRLPPPRQTFIESNQSCSPRELERRLIDWAAIDFLCRPCGVVQFLLFLDSCIQKTSRVLGVQKMKMNIHGFKMYGIKVGPYICRLSGALFDVLLPLATLSLDQSLYSTPMLYQLYQQTPAN